ncbi:MAG: VWA domain-containing protein [Acidobacteria bacterium]|nr:VWA domain-containing protein [Acidobacteriota bacterium]
MSKIEKVLGAVAGVWLAGVPALGQFSNSRGKVVMEDGSPPPKPVMIQRNCGSGRVTIEGTTNRAGEFQMRASQFETVGNWGSRQFGAFGTMTCGLEAVLPGYVSSVIDLDDITLYRDRDLPPLVLRKKGTSPAAVIDASAQAPKVARKSWEAGIKALNAGANGEAELHFRQVLKAAPGFAPAWSALGSACQNLKKLDEARAAFRRAREADAKSIGPLVLLMRLEAEAKDWPAASAAAESVIARDGNRRYPEAFLRLAVARYQSGDREGAIKSITEAVRLDKDRRMPAAEYIHGLILEAGGEIQGAGEHYRRYLELDPKGTSAQVARMRLAELGKPGVRVGPSAMEGVALDVKSVKRVWVPGGMKALGAMVEAPPWVGPEAFFEEYCRAFVRNMEPSRRAGIPGYLEGLRAYFAAIPELTGIGERRGSGVVVSLSLMNASRRAQAERALRLLGFRLAVENGETQVEYGDATEDPARQRMAWALGIDEIAMQEALAAGRSYDFEITEEEAPLMGGDAWLGAVKERQALAGGLAEAFTRDLRLARLYAGLGAAGNEAAEALVSGMGLEALWQRHSEAVSRCGPAFRTEGTAAVTPGGKGTEGAWTALAGADPANASVFFKAVLEKDHGKLASFYCSLWKAGAGKARYFVKTAERARAFYDAHEAGAEEPEALYRDAPLDGAGNLRFPGGRQAWVAAGAREEGLLLQPVTAEALAAVAKVEERRGTSVNGETARLLKEHYREWRPLWEYFWRLKGLGEAELGALAGFEKRLAEMQGSALNAALGEWYTVVELAALASDSGRLDARRGAEAFRLASEGKTAEALRAMGGSAAQLAAEGKPRLEALTAAVYAAKLGSGLLLMAEDSKLAEKHWYGGSEKRGPLFRPAMLERSSKDHGSRLTGGFMGIAEVVKGLQPAGARAVQSARASESPTEHPLPGGGEVETADYVIRSDVRLVEVYTTALDGRGRYVDDLTPGDFEVLEEGKAQSVVAFEPRLAGVTCALVLDSTLSMRAALPTLKNAALNLVGKTRPADQVAVYTFNDVVTEAQAPTEEKGLSKRAVARAQARGETALYDALVRVIADMSTRQGKKVIVLFTDGDDNKSTLTVETAVKRAKAAGIPVYTVAQGMALDNRGLLHELEGISKSTGGLTFGIREAREIGSVFEHIAADLAHGYLLTFKPAAAAEQGKWRRIEVRVKGGRVDKVRARGGYYAE